MPRLDGGRLLVLVLVLVLVHAALALTWLGSYVYLVSRACSVFERPRVRRLLDRVTAWCSSASGCGWLRKPTEEQLMGGMDAWARCSAR